METLSKNIHRLTMFTKWGAIIGLFMMMLLITTSVISRALFSKPIIGDYELVEFMMLTIIALSLAYVEHLDGHVKVGLVVDRLPKYIQEWIDLVLYIIVFAFCIFIGTVQLMAAIKIITGNTMPASMILSIPHYPFKFILAIGFYMWALESLLRFIYKLITLIKGNKSNEENSDPLEQTTVGGRGL